MSISKVVSSVAIVAALITIGIGGFIFSRMKISGRFWSINLGKSAALAKTDDNERSKNSYLFVSLYNINGHGKSSPEAVSRKDLNDFWVEIGVKKEDWERLESDRRQGRARPILSQYPLLSEMADVEVDNVVYTPEQIPDLQAELCHITETNRELSSNIALAIIAQLAVDASAHQTGLIISPFA